MKTLKTEETMMYRYYCILVIYLAFPGLVISIEDILTSEKFCVKFPKI